MKERKSDSPNSPSGPFAQHAKEIHSQHFRLITELFYEPKKFLSHEELSHSFGQSKASTKRMLKFLRETGVVYGRLPNLKLNLALLAEPPLSFSTALVAAEPDIKQLRELAYAKSNVSTPYNSEGGLLDWLCNSVPRTEPYKGQILIETGHIVLGAPFGLVFIVRAVSNDVLFKFVMLEVERAVGIHHTSTWMISHTRREPGGTRVSSLESS